MSAEDVDFTCKPEEFDPYRTLNVTPDATLEEIQASFKKLSRTFHPDRNSTAFDSLTLDASRLEFEAITKAKEILCNSQTRQAYDTFGNKGIEMMQRNMYNEVKSLQIGKQYRNNDAVKHLLKYYLKQEAKFELDKLVSSHGHCEVGIDATSLYQEFVDLIFRHETIPQFITNLTKGIPTLQIVIDEQEYSDNFQSMDESEVSISELVSLSVEDQVSIIQNALNTGDMRLLKSVPVQRQKITPELLSFLISLGFQYDYNENNLLVLGMTQFSDDMNGMNKLYQSVNIEWHAQWNRFLKFISALNVGLNQFSSRFTISRSIDSKTTVDINLFCNFMKMFGNDINEGENAADLFENMFEQNKDNLGYLYVIPELGTVLKNGLFWSLSKFRNILSFNGGYPGFDISFGVQRILFNEWLGISSIRMGNNPSFSWNLLRSHGKKQWSFKMEISPKTFVTLLCKHNLKIDRNFGFYIGGQLDVINLLKFECGFHKLCENDMSDKDVSHEIEIRQSFGIDISVKQGISIRFGYKRGPSQINVPIKCTDGFSSLKHVLLSLSVPVLTYYGYKLYYKAYLRKCKTNNSTKYLNSEGLSLHNKRQFALKQQSVMSRESLKSQSKETNENGLVILCAYYGDHVQHKLFDSIRKYMDLDKELSDSDSENMNEAKSDCEVIEEHDLEEKEENIREYMRTNTGNIPPPLLFEAYPNNNNQSKSQRIVKRQSNLEKDNKYIIKLCDIDWLNIENELEEIMSHNPSEDMHLLSFINVRSVLQYMVNNDTSELVLASGSKAYLPGFYDCCPDTYLRKELFVIYRYKNQYKYVTIADMFPLTLPNDSHLEWFNCRKLI